MRYIAWLFFILSTENKKRRSSQSPLFHFVSNFRRKSACDPGATRTPNQQNRNLSFYPLNYGTILLRKNITKRPVLQVNRKIYLNHYPIAIMHLQYLTKFFYFCRLPIKKKSPGRFQQEKMSMFKIFLNTKDPKDAQSTQSQNALKNLFAHFAKSLCDLCG